MICQGGNFYAKLAIFLIYLKNFIFKLNQCPKSLLIAIPNRNCLTHLVKQSACKELII